MQKKRHPSSLLIGLLLLPAADHASAIGWARAQRAAVLGRPLDFHAELRLDPGDVVAPECVAADVAVGDRSLPPHLVRLQVDASNPEALSMRVATSVAVDEPLVVVTLAIGCPARMARHFTLLADPPAGAPATMAAGSPIVITERTAAVPVPVADALAAPQAVVAPQRTTTAPPRRAAAATVAGETSAAPPRRRPSAAPAAPARAQARASPSSSSRRMAAASPARPAAPVPRLRLDPVEPAPVTTAAAFAVDDALQAVAQAASATRAAASAASAAERRIAALERSVALAEAQARTERERAQEARRRATEADGEGRLLMPLLLLLLALVILSGWLGWRLRRARLEREASWRRVVGVEPVPLRTPAPAPPPDEPPPAPPTVPPTAPGTLALQAGPPTVSLPKRDDDVARTQTLPPPVGGPARDVSIDELLDLEQQAEFFVVIGQDDAAIEILAAHVRDTGGGSPLPYLKLLEIYRRRGDREAYERTRDRFNHRFNAYAPEWNSDLQQGRSLDDYPGVLPRLQALWPRPLDAMAELEALLFRKSRGELFELPAYREVLFLYALARDLLDREAASTGNVDLLLPLADGGEFGITTPHPYFGLERESVFDPGTVERPTAPVDFDLSQFDGPAGQARKPER